MPPPRVIRVTRVDSSAKPAGQIKSRLRRVRGILDATEEYPRRLAARWAVPLFVLAFLAIVYCTLFPFNFKVPLGMTLRQAAAQWHWELFDPSDREDWFENVSLFLPFGFATACVARSMGASRRWLILISLGATGIFSTSIEILQLWLPTRDSSLADILANATGGFLGGALFAGSGTLLLARGGPSLQALRRALTFPVCLLLILAFLAVALIGPYHLRHNGRELSSWNPGYFLALGSEPSSISHIWHGTFESFDLANASLTPAAVARAYQGTPLSQLFPAGSIEYSYIPDPDGPGEFVDRHGKGPPVRWSGPKSIAESARPLKSAEHGLVSAEPLTQFNQSVASGKALTVRAIIQSARPYQDERRIIAALCKDATSINFTLMQDRADLMLHICTLRNGNRPVRIIPDLFAQPGTHDILMTYQEPVLRVYVDSAARCFVASAPEDFYEVGRFTARFERLPMNGFGLEIYRILYYFILFVPIGLLLGVIVTDPRTPSRIRKWVAIAGPIGPLLIMQGALLIVDRRTPRADNILWNFVLPLLAMTLMIAWLDPGQLSSNLRTTANVIRRRGR